MIMSVEVDEVDVEVDEGGLDFGVQTCSDAGQWSGVGHAQLSEMMVAEVRS
jgi:hypothetical protein